MTDLEMTKLCAEALKIFLRIDGGNVIACEMEDEYIYRPLINAADTLELVEAFDMVIEREKDKSFGITLFTNKRKGGNPTFVVRNQPKLKRAIVECVAKMQASKA